MANRFWVGGTATWDATALLKWSTTSGGVGGAAVPTAADDVFFDAASGVGTVTCSVGVCRNIDFTGFAGTFAGAGGVTVSGSFKWGAGMTQSHTGPVVFNATAGTLGITSNGKSFGGAVTFNGVGGTWQLQDALTAGGTITLTNGAFDTNAKNLSCVSFAGSGTNVRSLTIANSTVSLTGNWSFSTTTNLTFSAAGSLLNFVSNTAAAHLFQAGTLTYGDVTFSGSGSGSLTPSTSPTMRDFTITNTGGATLATSTPLTITRDFLFIGYTGTWSGSSTAAIGRHFATSAGMTVTSLTGLTFNATSGVNTITTNGVSLTNAITFDGVGGTWQLQDALTTSRGLTLTNGTLDTNGKAVSSQRLLSVNTNARALSLGATIWTFTGLNQTILDFTGAGLTFAAGSSLIRINNTGSTVGQSQNFTQGSGVFNDVQFFGTGAGDFNFTSVAGAATFRDFMSTVGGATFIQVLGSNSFASFTVLNSPHTLTFGAGTTQTIAVMAVTGSAGSPLSIRSTVPGTQARLSVPNNYVAGDYIDVKDCVATGGAKWFAGRHGVNSGNNNGWRFTDKAPRPPVLSFAA